MLQLYRFGPYEFDLERNELRKFGIPVKLERKPLQLLLILLDRAAELVTRGELQQLLWGEGVFVDFEKGLGVATTKLRAALNDPSGAPKYIETVTGHGYRFIAPVERIEAARIAPTADPVVPPRGFIWARRFDHRRLLLAGGVALFAAIAGIMTLLLLHLRSRPDTQGVVRVAPRAVRIAVLPFVNVTGDPHQQYLCDGITEETIAVLGSLSPERLDVIAPTSAMHYKNTAESVTQIGQELRVDYLLESSVQGSGSGFRITSRLIHASDGSNVWAGEFDLKSDNGVRSQQEVTAAIADSVKVTLSPASDARSARVQTDNPEAYRCYLLGRYYWNKRSREALQSARIYFEGAIERDPKYARAYSGLADDYLVLGAGYMPAEEAYPRAKATALKALELDSHLAEAYASLAYEQFIEEWDWQEAEANYRRSLALDPSYATAHEWYAIFLAAMRRSDEAVKEIDRALELDPLSLAVNYNAASIYLQVGRNVEAFELAKKSLEIDPNSTPAHLTLAAVYEKTGRYPEAIAEFQMASRAGGEGSAYPLLAARCYALAGNRARALEILRRWLPTANGPLGGAYAVALVYAALGEKDEALSWLPKAVEQRSCSPSEINTDWRLDSLRADARFAEIRARFKLPN
jgi:TolB-like protein/DNA-binding winged helix-turn-helix (wHTH) protein/Flp pilus assembly protein TadD